MPDEQDYEIYAVHYGHHDRQSPANYIGGDAHDILQPLDYHIWAVVGEEATYILDTGFDAAMGRKRISPRQARSSAALCWSRRRTSIGSSSVARDQDRGRPRGTRHGALRLPAARRADGLLINGARRHLCPSSRRPGPAARPRGRVTRPPAR